MQEKKFLSELREAYEEWEKKHQAEFNKERKSEFVSEGEIPVNRVYTPLDMEEKGFDYQKELGFPGDYPFVRGITATMGRSQPMILAQYSGYGSPEESNKLWKSMIAAGATSMTIAYDLPSQLGSDPDSPKAEGEVGRTGCSISSQREWEIALDGINLSKLMVNQVYNAPAIFGIANHLILAEKQGIPFSEVRGACQNDTLKEYYSRGNYIFPPAQSIRLVGDILAYCGKYAPRYNAAQVCGIHQAEMGATTVHEIAFALADAIAYLQAAVGRGIDVDLIAPSMMFVTSIRHYDFFEQIAKHRAARRIWAKIMKERFKAKKPESQMIRFRTAIGGSCFYKEEYLNNIARGALGGIAAAMVGVQSFYMTCYDEAFGIPTKEAIITSLQTSRVAAFETGCSDVVDPLAGSYYVESITSELEEKILEELETIDKRGGAVKCIEDGYFHRVIAQDAYKWQKRFESGELIRVGVNTFKTGMAEDRPMRIYRSDPKEENKRRTAMAELRKKRDNNKVKKALDEIKTIASLEPTAQNNLFPPVLEAARCYGTVGEVCDVLRQAWGEYREAAAL